MKHLLIKGTLAALVCVIVFTLAVNVSAQVYPSRAGNYCLLPGAVASASSSTNGFSAASAIDGDRIGQNCAFGPAPCWGSDGGWNDATRDMFPDWLRVDFPATARARSVSRIVVVTFQDNFSTPRIEPYLGLQVGNNYTIEDFTIEVLNTSGAWVEVADVEENLDIIREFTFAPVLGTAVRVTVNNSYVHYSRIVELEAYAN